MPITVDALKLALMAGVRDYDTNQLGLTSLTPGQNDEGPLYNVLAVQIFGTAVTNAQNLQSPDSRTDARFTAADATPDSVAPNFKVKSYLDKPVVCSVSKNGAVGKIAFILIHNRYQLPMINSFTWTHTSESTVWTNEGFPNEHPYMVSDQSNENGLYGQADVFMVITISPAISVTAGGYLTVKGFASGVTGSDSYTYVTLQSGS